MGTEKFFRNGFFRGTVTATKTLTASSDLSVTGGITATVGTIDTVQTVTSTATTLNGYGTVVINSTKAGVRKYVLPAPTAGKRVSVFAGTLTGSSASRKVITSSTAVVIVGTTAATYLGYSLSRQGETITLMGTSAKTWRTACNLGATGSTSR